MGRRSVGATFQLGGKFGVGYSGGTRKAILIWLMSPSSLALPHIVLPSPVCVGAVNGSGSPRLAFAQIAPGDLAVAVLGQLSPSQLPFDRQLEAGPLEMEGFEATLRCRGLIEQSLEDPPSNADRALVLAEQHAELDRIPVVV